MNLDARVAVLNVARSLSWVKETQGSNRGEVVDQMVREVGLDPTKEYPWCAAFVAYVGKSALGTAWPLKRVAGCVSLRDDAMAKGMLRANPTPGAIFLIYGKAGDHITRFKHTGFISAMNPSGGYDTIEGNTSPDGSPEGTGVFLRNRRFSGQDRFIHWWEP